MNSSVSEESNIIITNRNASAPVNIVTPGFWPRNEKEDDYRFKIGIIGDSGVGKSCLLLRYVDDTYTEGYISTIGADFKIADRTIDNKKVKLQIWDHTRDNKNYFFGTNYARNFQAMMMVVDITDKMSFDNIKLWLNEIERYRCTVENCVFMLVANKTDWVTRRSVSEEELQTFARDNALLYAATSAKLGTGVEEAFSLLTKTLIQRYPHKQIPSSSIQELHTPKKSETSSCIIS